MFKIFIEFFFKDLLFRYFIQINELSDESSFRKKVGK